MPDTVSTSSIEGIITGRRTIHDFKSAPVPPVDIIRRAIAAARWAPNHRLTEPWHFYVLGKESISGVIQISTDIAVKKYGNTDALKKKQRWEKVPGWLVLTSDCSDDPLQAREDYGACCCAAQNLMLYLWSHGIGVKWTTGDVIRDQRYYDLLWIDPRAETVIGMFWYGYPEEIPVTERKPLEQILIELP